MTMGRPRTGVTSQCKTCGTEIYSHPSRIKSYCCIKCRDAGVRLKTYDDKNNLKRCSKCQTWKSFSLFSAANGEKQSKNALQSYCNECASKVYLKYTINGKRNGSKPRGSTPVGAKRIETLNRSDLPNDSSSRKKVLEKEWRLKNREKVLMWNRLRLQRQRAAGEGADKHDVQRMLCHQDYSCIYCKARLFEKFHIDHKTPISREGKNNIENLQILCPTCNMKKGALTHEEYLSRLQSRQITHEGQEAK